jgi:hypothetical protein
VVARQLGSHTTGYITWKSGSGSSMETSIVQEYENSRLQLGLQVREPPHPTPPVDKTWLMVFCSVARNQQLFCVALISLQDRRWHKIAHWTEVRVTLKLVFCVSCVTIAHKLGTQFSSPFSHHRLGLLESQLSYGADRKISEHSNLGASITIGSLTGVRLKIR